MIFRVFGVCNNVEIIWFQTTNLDWDRIKEISAQAKKKSYIDLIPTEGTLFSQVSLGNGKDQRCLKY